MTVSPKKYYSIDDTCKVQLSPSAKGATDAIYTFRRKSDKAAYIGMTSCVAKRVLSHEYSFRHPEKEAGKSKLARAVQKDPTDFEFGILTTQKEQKGDLSLAEIEARCIEAKKPLFNVRRGGGGGSKKTKKSTKSQAEVAKKVEVSFKTPEKTYRLSPKSYKVKLTPTAKGDLYIFKTEEARYIGRTERQASNRLSEHSHYARHPEKERGQQRLYSDIRNAPENFTVALVSSENLGIEDPDMAESALIEHYTKQGKPLYNKNKGGGGPHKTIMVPKIRTSD